MEIYRMKLFRFGQPDHEKPAVLVDGRRLDVSEFGEDYNEAILCGGRSGAPAETVTETSHRLSGCRQG
jgi:2,4-didehydro-3-deoxy-L-rhamnonate hydrolase